MRPPKRCRNKPQPPLVHGAIYLRLRSNRQTNITRQWFPVYFRAFSEVNIHWHAIVFVIEVCNGVVAVPAAHIDAVDRLIEREIIPRKEELDEYHDASHNTEAQQTDPSPMLAKIPTDHSQMPVTHASYYTKIISEGFQGPGSVPSPHRRDLPLRALLPLI